MAWLIWALVGTSVVSVQRERHMEDLARAANVYDRLLDLEQAEQSGDPCAIIDAEYELARQSGHRFIGVVHDRKMTDMEKLEIAQRIARISRRINNKRPKPKYIDYWRNLPDGQLLCILNTWRKMALEAGVAEE